MRSFYAMKFDFSIPRQHFLTNDTASHNVKQSATTAIRTISAAAKPSRSVSFDWCADDARFEISENKLNTLLIKLNST